MDRVESGEVQVGAVHDVERSRFECDLIEDVDVVDFGVGDEDDGRDVVLGVARDHARPAAVAGIEVDRHGPAVLRILVRPDVERLMLGLAHLELGAHPES